MIAVVLALGLLPELPTCEGNSSDSPARYLLDVRVCRGDPLGSREEGTVRYLAEPQISTQAGRPAFFVTGKTHLDHLGINSPGSLILDSGVQLELLPVPGPFGLVHLEVGGMYRTPTPDGIAEQSRRVSRLLAPGHRLRVRLAADSPTEQTWVEVTVREVAPRAK